MPEDKIRIWTRGAPLTTFDLSNPFLAISDIYTDEAIRSFLQRQMKSLPGASGVRLRELLGGTTDVSWIFPSRLKKVYELFSKLFKDHNQLIYKHTCFPAWILLLADDDLSKLYQAHLTTSGNGVSSSGHKLLRHVHRARPTICLSCLKEQRKDYGRTYWRRFDFLPGISACGKHVEPRYTYCELCSARRGSSFELPPPSERCECPSGALRQIRNFENSSDLASEAGLTSIMIGLATSELTQCFSNSDYRALLEKSTRRMGLEGKVNLQHFGNLVKDKVGEAQVAAWRIVCNEQSAFVRGARGNETCRNIGQNAVLIKALFGDFDGLIQALHGSSSESRSTLVAVASAVVIAEAENSHQGETRQARYIKYWKSLPRDKFEKKRAKLREYVLELKRRDPEAGRLKVGYWPGVFLMNCDREWYDQNLPRKDARYGLALEKMIQHGLASNPEKMAETIRETRRLLDQSLPSRRICASMLFSSLTRFGGRKSLESRPIVLSALDECEETREEWEARKMQMYCQKVAKIDPKSQYADPAAFLGLTDEARRARFFRLQHWLRKHK